MRSQWLTIALVSLGALVLAACDTLGIHDAQTLFAPALKRSEIVGFVAGLGTTFAALPDLVAMLRRRSTAGMNPRMSGIMGVFQVLWLYYGLLIASRPVIVWNAIGVVINTLNVCAFLYFRRRERSRARQ